MAGSAMTGRRRYPYAVLDVFAERALEGNPLAVVHDADDVDEGQMLALARETRLSETCFVQSASAHGADYRNRIWTVRREIPFAGHPSLGVAVAVALRSGTTEGSYVQQTGVGLQRIDVRLDQEVAQASMLQEPAVFGPEVDARHVLAAVGLMPGNGSRELPPQVVSTGLDTLVAPVNNPGCLSEVQPDLDLISALAERTGASTLYLVHVEGGTARARMFTDQVVGGEDPATGSAAGPLCAYLAERGRGTRIEISQGVEMGRPSRLVAEMEDGRPRVEGGVVRVVEGEVLL
jgi:trans-2,3-dihydro-3-hydroxyanthranilate isomerase